MTQSSFEWDEIKDKENQIKHGVSFFKAQQVFMDNKRIIIRDEKHSDTEERLFCIGKVDYRILTVRFTYRDGLIRIFGAGEWRKWKKYYEQENA
jgi:uncharacterized DUF497 family protein